MMQLVSGDDVGQGANGNLSFAGGAAAQPIVGIELLEQENRRAANGLELLDQAG
jgi:hypothetical protein